MIIVEISIEGSLRRYPSKDLFEDIHRWISSKISIEGSLRRYPSKDLFLAAITDPVVVQQAHCPLIGLTDGDDSKD